VKDVSFQSVFEHKLDCNLAAQWIALLISKIC